MSIYTCMSVYTHAWVCIHSCIVWLQGYNNLLRDIFEDAGLLKSQRVKVRAEAPGRPEVHASLQECSEVRTRGAPHQMIWCTFKCQRYPGPVTLLKSSRTSRNRVKKLKDYAHSSATTTFPLNPPAVSPLHSALHLKTCWPHSAVGRPCTDPLLPAPEGRPPARPTVPNPQQQRGDPGFLDLMWNSLFLYYWYFQEFLVVGRRTWATKGILWNVDLNLKRQHGE